jgi:hypothetical protein
MDAQLTLQTVNFAFGSALMLAGIIVSFVVKMAILEDAGQHYTPVGYLRLHPWRSLALVLTTWALLYVFHEMGELTRVSAVLLGFTCEQSNDTLRALANKRTTK